MTDASLIIDSGRGPRRVALFDYLDPAAEEAAADASLAWIKRIRQARVDGLSLRRRFTFRGESLWWFTELYLHKEQVVLDIFRTLSALESLVARERPLEIRVEQPSRIVSVLAREVASVRRIRFVGRTERAGAAAFRLAAMDARSTWLHLAALASRLRPRRAQRLRERPLLVAFVHRAFWRADSGDGSAESYIGPVLRALERRVPTGRLRCVGVGPATNFRARRWWHALKGKGRALTAPPIEVFAPLTRLGPSNRVWRRRHIYRRALWGSDDLRRAAVIQGCDCWPLLRDELAGVALLQWPWSARAMDEAAAALDALRPEIVLTYAEAGGWGRALMLECRRRNTPTAGLQHGFIYRHWLNYRHEPDEMTDDGPDSDRGFPRPSLSLLFDEYAARHLEQAGNFPRDAIAVTGSPRLDDLMAAADSVSAADLERIRQAAGARDGDALVLVATKHREARASLPDLIEAAGRVPGVHLAIKTHPAETPAVYSSMTSGRAHVSVFPADVPLAPLLRASRALVTVNSTVALDAAVLGVPALVIGLPNNLSPFVDLGVLAGAGRDDLPERLRQILYDEEFRQTIARAQRDFLSRFRMVSTGRAAEATAEAVLALAGRSVAEAAR